MSELLDRIESRGSGAIFSPCRRWRYLLVRAWDPALAICMFVGLNPSTADETDDDPTIRRCVRFARDWGFGTLWMTNLFAYRATDPKALKAVTLGAVGPMNNEYLHQANRAADLTVLAWGAHGSHEQRDKQVLGIFLQDQRGFYGHSQLRLACLGVTAGGHPRHPLYLPADTQLQPWPVKQGGVAG